MRQGCPLSPLLSAIAVELLAIAICSNREIKGIWRAGVEHKVPLYADDLLLFISEPATSLAEALTVLELFSKFSGCKLNLNKSELFPISKEALSLNILGYVSPESIKNVFKANFLSLLKQANLFFFQMVPHGFVPYWQNKFS